MKKQSKKTYKVGQISKYVSAICDKYKLEPMEVKAFLFSNFPELGQKEHCNNCGASMKMFWHNITPGLVGCLIKAIEFVKANNKNCFHLQHDLNLSKNEYNNFQKLRFHGLIAHEGNKVGYWLITTRGGAFLRGEIAIPVGVLTFRNHIQEHSIETVTIKDFKYKYPNFQSEFAFEYKRQDVGELPIKQGQLL